MLKQAAIKEMKVKFPIVLFSTLLIFYYGCASGSKTAEKPAPKEKTIEKVTKPEPPAVTILKSVDNFMYPYQAGAPSSDAQKISTVLYDSKGQMIETDVYNPQTGEIAEKYTYAYDSKGNRIETIKYDQDGRVDRRYEYKYDKEGRKYKTISYKPNGKIDKS
jgi:hypothetical protein